MTVEPAPTPDAIREQLMRIVESEAFKGSEKQRRFLSYVVDEALADRASELKGYTIAIAVYGRSPNFDPQVDPIVRVEAGRLRRALDKYYLTVGRNDPIRIDIPKGRYIPTFETVKLQSPYTAAVPEETMPPTIAVLPLLNLTGDPTQDYFVDGLTDEITTELARYQDFRVIASQSAMRFKAQQTDPVAVGGYLGARFLLSGSVRKDKALVKVTVRLVDATSGAHIWGEDYKRDLTPSDLIAIQEAIGQRLVGAVADHYGLISRRLSMESRKKAPNDLKVYDAILRFYHYETVLTPEVFEEALTALEQAVALEPDYGLAWSMLGHLHADNYALQFSPVEEPLEKALAYAQRGIALAPQNQFASDALALVYFHRGDKAQFLRKVDLTIALNPNAPYIIGVAGWHLALYGEWDRGLTLLHKGMQLNPYYPSWFHLATFMNAYRQADYQTALDEAIKFNFPDLYLDPMMRAAVFGQMGEADDARAAIDELVNLVPDFLETGRGLLARYVKVDQLTDAIFEGLHKAGLENPGRDEI